MATIEYRPAGAFMFRAPAFPFAMLIDACGGVARLRALAADPYVRGALAVASPGFAARVDEWRSGTAVDAGVERALVRYLSRMAGRATPFGLFAGVSVGGFADATRLDLGPRSRHARHSRLDTEYLGRLCASALRDPALRQQARWIRNSTLYRTGGRWRYVEAHPRDGQSAYQLVAVADSPHLESVLARAAHGASIAELVDVLRVDPELDGDDANAFVEELIEAQLLLPDLAPHVTGPEPLGALIDTLAALPAGQDACATLRHAAAALAEHDASVIVPTSYDSLVAAIAPLVDDDDRHNLLHVDLYLDATATLSPIVVAELHRGVEVLRRLVPPPPDDDVWSRFRTAFTERYDRREVPLGEVLDEESGIGFGERVAMTGASLVADLAFPNPPAVPGRGPEADEHLLALYARAIGSHDDEIVLGDADLDALARGRSATLPDTFAVIAEIVATSGPAVDAGAFVVKLHMLPGASGARLFGRFCHHAAGFGPLVRELAHAEAQLNPDRVLAEIVHQPGNRGGNLVARPALRDHEIPCLGLGGAAPDRRLLLSDLLVSVVGRRVVVRSARLDQEVRPLLSAAHNFEAHDLALYRFLCALAHQDLPVGEWRWGTLHNAPFLPRVRHGRLILATAQWRLSREDLEPVRRAARTGSRPTSASDLQPLRERVFAAVQDLRAARRLPRWIIWANGDNELIVDLDSPLSIDSFVHLVLDQAVVRIRELLTGPTRLCASGSDGGYVHELVVPFIRAGAAISSTPPRTRSPSRLARRLSPGSSWTYVKLYGGASALDAVLRDVVGPFVRQMGEAGVSERFFFVRYTDPDLHLRLRFEGDPHRLVCELWPALDACLAPTLRDGSVRRVQLDTYERELERYGGDRGMVLSEAVFASDSLAVLDVVTAYRGDEEARWRLTLRGIDTLLIDLGLSTTERFAVLDAGRDGLGADLGIDTEFQRRLGTKFRATRAELSALLGDAEHPLAAGFVSYAARTRRLVPIVTELRAAWSAGELAVSIPQLAASYIHMHVNRMLITDHRRQELVLYDLLRRHYAGIVARDRGTKS